MVLYCQVVCLIRNPGTRELDSDGGDEDGLTWTFYSCLRKDTRGKMGVIGDAVRNAGKYSSMSPAMSMTENSGDS